jgi:hypothetical protein
VCSRESVRRANGKLQFIMLQVFFCLLVVYAFDVNVCFMFRPGCLCLCGADITSINIL